MRRWQRNPLLAVHVFTTIALGMAVVTAVLSLLITVAFQPLPFRESERIVQVWNRVESGAAVYELSGAEVVEIEDATRDLFENIGGFYSFPFWIMDEGGGAAPLHVARLEQAAFRALDLRPVIGNPVDVAAPGTEG